MKICFRGMVKVLAASVALAMALGVAQVSLASISFTGSGTNPGDQSNANLFGEADFSISGSTLTVVLTNTGGTASPTDAPGGLLTGLMFDVMSTSSTFSSMSLTPASTIWNSSSGSNNATPIAGSWTPVLSVGSYSGSAVNSGVATTGKLLFNGGSISLGNASPDYGIATNGSFPGGFGGSQYPFIQDSLTFTFLLSSGSVSDSSINDVFFLFGTNNSPGGVFPGTPGTPNHNPSDSSVPEPTSLVIWGVVSAATAGAVAMRKQKSGCGRWSEADRNAIYKLIGGNSKV